MKSLYLFILLTLPIMCMAKTNGPWNNGIVILSNNEVLEGTLKYDQKHEVIQIKLEGTVKAFSSHSVNYFEFYDEKSNVLRKYSACAIESKPHINRRVFYEIVLEGDFTLLRKDLEGSLPDWVKDTYVNDSKEYAYYIIQHNSVEKLTNFEKQVLPQMSDESIALEDFINKNNFNFTSPTSQILIINYYNHLKRSTKAVSSL